MTCCTRNPFVPDYENVIWLCSGDPVPAGWRELSRWSFQSKDAVVVWPVGVDLPPDPMGGRAVLSQTGGVVTQFSRDGVDYTQVMWRASGSMTIDKPVSNVRWALVGGGGSGGMTNRSSGGGGAGGLAEFSGGVLAGGYSIQVGAGGAGLTANAPGNPGSPSRLLLSGIEVSTALGGGFGSGNGNGGDGACGGGAGTNGTPRVGGIGSSGFNGGNSVATAGSATEGGGGGGGMSGSGLDGQARIGGNGGGGVTITWTNAPLGVCGGGGGKADNLGISGTASHGGTAGASQNGTSSANASNGGGSGGGNASTGSGGDGLFVIVFRSESVVVM